MPLFIVFEGIDGSGKTTQARELQNYFLDRGQKAVLSPEPSTGIIGSLIREFALQKKLSGDVVRATASLTNQDQLFFPQDSQGHNRQDNLAHFSYPHRFDEQMAYLFAADRYYHLYNNINGVFKLIDDGCHVLTTRYYFSSLAYNSGNEAQESLVKQLNSNFPNPDLVIYLDLPVEIALDRLGERKEMKEVYETEEKLIKVSKNYTKVFDEYGGKLLKIQATKSINCISQAIIAAISP
jgi:dTMP kinase